MVVSPVGRTSTIRRIKIIGCKKSATDSSDILTKEIASRIEFADKLSDEDRATFTRMLDDCYKYSKAIKAKGRPFPTEPVSMALLF